jgi:hypothetical protein
MPVDTEGASGPQGNAAEGKVDALDAALEKAMGPIDDGSDDFPPLHLKEKLNGDRKSKVAGDESGSEDARAAGNKAEAPPAEATPSGVPELREAPTHWPDERRKAFAGWPKEVQDHALAVDKDLQAGFTRKSMELSDQAKFAESIRGLFGDHHRQQFAQAGVDEIGAVRHLIQLHDAASRDPVSYLRWAMQSFGVTPEHLGFSTRQPEQRQQQPAGNQPPVSTGDPKLDALLGPDPEVAQLRSQFGQFSQAALGEISALKQQLAQRAHQEQTYARQQQVAAQQSLVKQWNDFRSAQDDHGQLAYPHSDALMQPMGALMDTHPVLKGMPDGPDKLRRAYEMALNADPELSKPVREAEFAKRMAEQQKKADAEKAKQAAKVRPATGAPTMPAKKGGIDAALEAAFAQLGGN